LAQLRSGRCHKYFEWVTERVHSDGRLSRQFAALKRKAILRPFDVDWGFPQRLASDFALHANVGGNAKGLLYPQTIGIVSPQ
jgi:hypothetical protein